MIERRAWDLELRDRGEAVREFILCPDTSIMPLTAPYPMGNNCAMNVKGKFVNQRPNLPL